MSDTSGFRLRLLNFACFCGNNSNNNNEDDYIDETSEKLALYISRGDTSGVEHILLKLRNSDELLLSVKQRHLKPTVTCLLDRNTDPFIHFYQECNPVVYAIDCKNWSLLPVLAKYNLDSNRPLYCRRWTYLRSGSRHIATPYQNIWTRGKYTYQSAIDYFFGSVYECFGDYMARFNDYHRNAQVLNLLRQLPLLIEQGVDVHRIDSVIIFNCLAYSLDWFLSRYTNEEAVVPDIPETSDTFIEMSTMRILIENGFSEFECMEFLSPCHNWFGILLSVLCHPRIETYGCQPLPDIIRQAALLLINFLALRCTFPSLDDFQESLDNLQLRKLYSKRYAESREEFNKRLQVIQKYCLEFKKQPLSLRFCCRKIIRKHLGGVFFQRKLAAVTLPQEIKQFITYVEVEQIKSNSFPPILLRLARGENVYRNQSKQ